MIQETLLKLRACDDAREWAKEFEDWQTLWDKCERGDWMLWLCGKYSGEPESEARKILVAAACDCAEVALTHVEKGEERPRIAIETARKWIKREATIEEVRFAADAAAYAAVAYAAYAAAYAAYAARGENLKKCAYIVRKHYPKPPINE